MKLTFVINDIATEKDNYTTIRLTRRAAAMGHDVSLVSLADLSYEADGSITADGVMPSRSDCKDDTEMLADLQREDAKRDRVCISEADVLMLRADPADEMLARPWAHSSSLLFAQLAAKQGVIVLNDPFRLTDASNKTYFQHYPAAIRPRTIISRDEKVITKFIEDEGGKAVIKPLQGSGGHGVFVITEGLGSNVNQMIEATLRDGYAIAQEYLPKAAEGDLRLITLNGRALKVDNTYACIRRYNETDDARSNISAGGKVEVVEPDADALRVAEMAGPKMIRDGMYMCGLDIVGDKMMEINVDTPGGLCMIEDLTEVDFSGAILEDLEHKVRMQECYGKGALGPHELAII
ncbi:glutathione synthase [Palleronia aestuarii]|uniref:Glutathione synthase n=1 Tax=Palleronia aestuarii TaxID=568105 RepID=A0A2W7NED7_9RHOB|nr:glutathione synthase [Palleronia aestuarii]PZX18801.1 glutathione synthase [Palleronia aestuarii]